MRMSDKPIYLDFAAATPLDERVLAVMQPFLTDQFYNPSSAYTAGRSVRVAVNNARTEIAGIIGAKPGEIIFTAGATESINMAVWGVCSSFNNAHIVTTTIEHPAVLAPAGRFAVSPVTVAPNTGMIHPDDIAAAITDDTVLVSVGYANGEIGTVQPIKQVAALVKTIRAERLRRKNSTPLYFHSDASQAAGGLDIHVDRLGVDLMTLSAGKCYGPKQTGLLYVKSPLKLAPLIFGGGQESGKRSGTENVPSIIGFAKALHIADSERKDESSRLNKLRDSLLHEVCNKLPDTIVSGHQVRHLPGVLHLAWPNLDGERILFALDDVGVMVSTGSACAANKGAGSHVLSAIGLAQNVANGSIRISMGRTTTEDDVAHFIDTLIRVVSQERDMA